MKQPIPKKDFHPLASIFPRLHELLTGPPLQLKKVSLTRKKIYILPSKHGFILALLLLGMLIGAINYNNNLGYLIVFFLSSCAVLSTLYTVQHLTGLEFSAGRSLSAFAGDKVIFKVLCQETKGLARHRIKITYLKDTQQLHIPPLGKEEITLHSPAEKRGRLPLAKLTISTTHPLGIFQAWAYVGLEQQAIVYPRPFPRTIDLITPDQTGSGQTEAEGQPPGSDALNDLKAYQSGESYRRIVWKIYARDKGLWSKVFTLNEGRSPLWLDFNHLPPSDLETRLSMLCRLILLVSKGDLKYGLILPGQTIQPDMGTQHKERCLTALADI